MLKESVYLLASVTGHCLISLLMIMDLNLGDLLRTPILLA